MKKKKSSSKNNTTAFSILVMASPLYLLFFFVFWLPSILCCDYLRDPETGVSGLCYVFCMPRLIWFETWFWVSSSRSEFDGFESVKLVWWVLLEVGFLFVLELGFLRNLVISMFHTPDAGFIIASNI